jgi:hypothetical protein
MWRSYGKPRTSRVEVPVKLWNARRRIVHVFDYHLVPREPHEGPEYLESDAARDYQKGQFVEREERSRE